MEYKFTKINLKKTFLSLALVSALSFYILIFSFSKEGYNCPKVCNLFWFHKKNMLQWIYRNEWKSLCCILGIFFFFFFFVVFLLAIQKNRVTTQRNNILLLIFALLNPYLMWNRNMFENIW